MKKLSLVSILLLVLIAMIGCGKQETKVVSSNDGSSKTSAPQATPQATTKAASGEPIKVGALYATTGRLGGMGTDQLNGAKIAIKKINDEGGINGQPVQLVHQDFESDPAKAVTLGRKMIEDGIKIIIGPNSTPGGLSLRPITEQNKIIFFSGSTVPEMARGSLYHFLVFPDDEKGGILNAQLIKDVMKWKKVGILFEDNAYGQNLSKYISQELEKSGVKVVPVSYATDAQNLTAQWQRIEKEKVEGVYVAGSSYGTAAKLMKNRTELGLTGLNVILEEALQTEAFIKLSGNDTKGAYFFSSYDYDKPTAQQKTFFDAMKKEYGINSPTAYSGVGFDQAYLPLTAVKQVGMDPDKIREYLIKLDNFEGASGIYKFTADYYSGKLNRTLVQWDGSKFKTAGTTLFGGK